MGLKSHIALPAAVPPPQLSRCHSFTR